MSGFIGERFDWADKVVGAAIEDSWAINGRSLDFVLQLADRLGRYGSQTFLSDGQIAWLEDIERKLEKANA